MEGKNFIDIIQEDSWRHKLKDIIENFKKISEYKNSIKDSSIKNDLEKYKNKIKLDVLDINIREYRDYFRTLNAIEMLKINEKLQLDKMSFEDNDIKKALALSGSFCKFNNETLVAVGSGMLVPGQSYQSNEYLIHSALHVFNDKNIKELYFVPSGYPIASDNAFAVTKLERHDEKKDLVSVDNNFLKKQNYKPYETMDYCRVTINNKAKQGQNTINKLYQKKEYGQNEFSEKLPEFLGMEKEIGFKETDTFFAVGRSSFFENDFKVSISLVPDNNKSYFEKVKVNEFRSHEDNPKYGFTPPVESIKPLLDGEFTSDIPSVPGTSGGPVLICKVGENKNLCSVIGTIWGTERIFDENKNFKNIKNIVNSIKK
jgi:hypothetical protein